MASSRKFFFWATVAIFAIALSSPASADVAQAEAPELFRVPDSETDQSVTVSNLALIASNIERVSFNEAALDAGRAVITLGGVAYQATRTMFESRIDQWSVGWTSRWTLEGATWPSTVTMRNGIVAGTFFDAEGRYFYLMPGYGPHQDLVEVDSKAIARLEAEAGNDVAIPPFASAAEAKAIPSEFAVVAGDDVVLHKITQSMYYTAAVSQYLGGDAAAEAAMANKLECINTNLANGGYTEGRVLLGRLRRYPHAETGDMLADLYALATDPVVAAQRDADRADLVSLWVVGVGGRGYLGGGPEGGFHILSVSSAIGNNGEEHEWGHNMYAQHDWEHADVFPPNWQYPYGYGHCGSLSDVMAYCNPRGPFFSNPGTYHGSPMGNLEQEDNLRVIALKFPEISAYYSDVTTGECVPSSTTLCLLQVDGVAPGTARFRVEVSWRTALPSQGQGQAVAITADTGYFWFFSPANVEMVIKVLDGRGVNNSFWVYAGGLTNVEVDVTVTDMATGAVWHQQNPLGTKFQPMQDVNAFPQ